MCRKRIKESTPLGTVYRMCDRPPEVKGLCLYHWNQRQKRITPWGKRPEYRDITEEEFLRGRSMKIKDRTKHVIYRFRDQVIQKQDHLGYWHDTDLNLPYTAFCIKEPKYLEA